MRSFDHKKPFWTDEDCLYYFGTLGERFRFVPKITDDLHNRAKEYIGEEVSVLSWHITDRGKVGYIKEFGLDIPENELK